MNAWRSAVVYRQFIDVDLHPWPTVKWRLSRPLELYGVRRAAMNAEFCRSHVTHWPNIHSPSRHPAEWLRPREHDFKVRVQPSGPQMDNEEIPCETKQATR